MTDSDKFVTLYRNFLTNINIDADNTCKTTMNAIFTDNGAAGSVDFNGVAGALHHFL